MRRSRSLRLLLALSLMQLAACVAWQPVSVSPEALFRESRPDRVRVTRTDGMQMVLEAPEIRAGALVATASPGAVLVNDVRELEVEKVDWVRTVALALPAPIILLVVGIRSAR